MAITQLRFEQVKGDFGFTGVRQDLTSTQLSSVNNEDLNDTLSVFASTIKRINGGGINSGDFSDLETGFFNLDIKPAIHDNYSLGNLVNSWKGIQFTSGSLNSVADGIHLSGSKSVIYSAPMTDDTISHNFQGVALELDSLANTWAEYNGLVEYGLYNISGGLYWGTTLLNAGYKTIKTSTTISSGVSKNQSLASNSNWSTMDLSDFPAEMRYNTTEVYVNGQLMHSGSQSDVSNEIADYYLNDTTETAADLIFGFDIEANDVITVVAKYTSNSAAFATGGTGGTTTASGLTVTGVKTSNYTAAADEFIPVNLTSADITISLPAASTCTDSQICVKISGNTSAHKVIVDANGSETIDGDATYELTTDYESLLIISTGTEWLVIA